jgi:hypothetical protein
LLSENTELKEIPKKSQTVEAEIQTLPIEKGEEIVDSDHFKIIKFYKSEFSMDGSVIVQKPEGELE